MAVAVAGSCSSHLTPGQGTSIYGRYSSKKKERKKGKKGINEVFPGKEWVVLPFFTGDGQPGSEKKIMSYNYSVESLLSIDKHIIYFILMILLPHDILQMKRQAQEGLQYRI